MNSIPIITQFVGTKGTYFLISLFSIVLFSCSSKEKHTPIPTSAVKAIAKQFHKDLDEAILHMDSLALGLPEQASKMHYRESRRFFKRLEPVLSAIDLENYNFLNQPNILKIEEEDRTDIKIKKPSGYQVVEETLYADTFDPNSVQLHAQRTVNRLRLVQQTCRFEHLKSYHFLWMMRKAFIRVAVAGITGFDSPTEDALNEAAYVFESLQTYLGFYESEFKDSTLFQQWNTEIERTIASLTGDFTNFDRYAFMKTHTLRHFDLWNATVADWEVTFPFDMAIQNTATSLFSPNTFVVDFFADQHTAKRTPEKIALGKRLFYDPNLSDSKTISCATCHHPDKAFTDGLKVSKNVTRNSPTLLYAALQQGFFYDRRAGSLEGQISSVIEDENEFHTTTEAMEHVIRKDTLYVRQFKAAYPNRDINHNDIRNAIASYIRTLLPFSSKLDKAMQGTDHDLTPQEINGFNLFHGKAKCATCHFPPLYNGTVPPDYRESEIELIGVPQHNDTINATISKDLGRYYVFQTEERKHFFKTPTVRNSAQTSPYMHNGVYTTLEEVIDFYNRGGGAGIGIEQEYQTLPPDPLLLTDKEIQDLIAFIHTLNDPSIEY